MYEKNRRELFCHYAWENFWIGFNLAWRLAASFIMSILACGGTMRQLSGEPHEWIGWVTAVMLFFCPWGSPMRNAFIEEYRQKEMERKGIVFWVEIRHQSCLGSLLLIWGDVYINGIFGIILGWRYFLEQVLEFGDNINEMKDLWDRGLW